MIARFDVLDLEVAAIGDDIDPLAAEDRAGRFGRLERSLCVIGLIGVPYRIRTGVAAVREGHTGHGWTHVDGLIN